MTGETTEVVAIIATGVRMMEPLQVDVITPISHPVFFQGMKWMARETLQTLGWISIHSNKSKGASFRGAPALI